MQRVQPLRFQIKPFTIVFQAVLQNLSGNSKKFSEQIYYEVFQPETAFRKLLVCKSVGNSQADTFPVIQFYFRPVCIQNTCRHRSSHRCSVRKGVLRNFTKFTRKHLCQGHFLIKLQACNFIKKRLWYRYFPVNFAKFLRRPYSQNTSERLLLQASILSHK